MSGLETLVLVLPVLLFSVVLHEWAHARAAVAQGDPTPAMLGRLTMNPVPHIDPIGSLLVPAALWLLPGGFIFGWAKPVPVNPRNYRSFRRGDILVSLAGVTANFVLALVCALLFAGLLRARAAGLELGAAAGPLRSMLRFGIFINVILGGFNLLPIPPLDGSHVLYHLLPPGTGARYRELGRYSVLLLLLVFLFPPLLDAVLLPVRFLTGLFMDLAFALAS